MVYEGRHVLRIQFWPVNHWSPTWVSSAVEKLELSACPNSLGVIVWQKWESHRLETIAIDQFLKTVNCCNLYPPTEAEFPLYRH